MDLYESSEAVAAGHPDKIADLISDAILDECLRKDPFSRVAVETLVSHRLISVGGEITTKATIDLDKVVRGTLVDLGYSSQAFGDLLASFQLVSSICEQSPEISQSVGDGEHPAAGDQGMVYGYACVDTPSFMPLSYELARGVVQAIQKSRSEYPFLGPDGKVQISICPHGEHFFTGSAVISWQHSPDVRLKQVQTALQTCFEQVANPLHFKPEVLLLNPSGKFVIGGPFADTGLTGRKQIVDSYGGSVPHGGGAYSGKDATKVDRSGAYMARYAAKHIVASGIAERCLVQLIFCIGKKEPLHIAVDCFQTEKTSSESIKKALLATFDFSVEGIIRDLNLRQPIFQKTAFPGHFGREGFSWETLDRIDEFLVNIRSS